MRGKSEINNLVNQMHEVMAMMADLDPPYVLHSTLTLQDAVDVCTLAFSPGGNLLAAGTKSGLLRIFALDNKYPPASFQLSSAITALIWEKDANTEIVVTVLFSGNSVTTSTAPSRAPSRASHTSRAPSSTEMKDSLTAQAILVQTLTSVPFPKSITTVGKMTTLVLTFSLSLSTLPLPTASITHIPYPRHPLSPVPSDINMSEQAQQPHFDMHRAEQIHQAATIQDIINAHGLLQEQVTTFLQHINQQQPQPQAHTISQSSDKSSMAKPEPFKGKAVDVRSFLASFRNWAGEQRDIAETKER
ncbi:hypothetical protein D9758_018973 [Tetrapyrgos nigripes]|uniref:Anaphase-promoting complex subunit 4 WD40 domain-containing protein n=1 Tax=Tetrapyrgos nigripes TaxID=182062 RepID=A0A8H5AV62_9AGAR|nr:hypothetical protein D9758_018973 [Tetrapyrgos nigripes]